MIRALDLQAVFLDPSSTPFPCWSLLLLSSSTMFLTWEWDYLQSVFPIPNPLQGRPFSPDDIFDQVLHLQSYANSNLRMAFIVSFFLLNVFFSPHFKGTNSLFIFISFGFSTRKYWSSSLQQRVKELPFFVVEIVPRYVTAPGLIF